VYTLKDLATSPTTAKRHFSSEYQRRYLQVCGKVLVRSAILRNLCKIEAR
jgi:hypothetical protein